MSNLKNIEVELKFPLKNKEEVIAKLNSIAKQDKNNETQIDTYYNPPHKDFLQQKPISEWLRLRESDNGVFFNYKNWHNKEGNAVSCDEYFTKIRDVEPFRTILKQLDFKEIVVVNKTRNTWIYKNVEIAIDKVEELGNFIEIEAAGNFKDIEEAKKHLYSILKEIGADVGNQDFDGYPYNLMKKKNLI
jgi:adenylate cyclase, class 2